jgi:hypothetical protein
MMQIMMIALALSLWGCATQNISRGATLLSGVNQYHGEMQRVGSQLGRWPERQQAATMLKGVITGTLGSSAEFYRLVDLDLRKREFVLTMRETNVGADRLKEMKQELAQMDDEIAALKPVIKTQLNAVKIADQPAEIESVATLGLLGIAVDGFSATGGRGLEAPSTKVAEYVITDLGSFATVRTPKGQVYRCTLFGQIEDGVSIRCE